MSSKAKTVDSGEYKEAKLKVDHEIDGFKSILENFKYGDSAVEDSDFSHLAFDFNFRNITVSQKNMDAILNVINSHRDDNYHKCKFDSVKKDYRCNRLPNEDTAKSFPVFKMGLTDASNGA